VLCRIAVDSCCVTRVEMSGASYYRLESRRKVRWDNWTRNPSIHIDHSNG